MDINQATDKLRLYLADPLQKIWQELELHKLLEEAVKQYSIDTCAFTGTFDLIPDEDGNYLYPDDFIGFVIGWNDHGREILPTSSFELFSVRRKSADAVGDVKYIFADSASDGVYAVHPLPADNQNAVSVTLTPFWGEVFTDSFGVFDIDGFGTTLSVTEYTFAGDCVYYRHAAIDEIQDYMALIYYAMYLAYSNMSDLSGADKAEAFLQRYKYRVDAFNKVHYSERGVANKSQYY